MHGAGVMCATAAARVGAGYVFLADSKVKNAPPDFLSVKKSNQIDFNNFSAIAFGPGLRNEKGNLTILKKLIYTNHPRVVLDAGAFDILAKNKITKLPATWILTPHEGELARLLKTTSSVIRKDRLKAILQAQKKFGCHIVLKGHHTLLATADQTYVFKVGNPALAKAGTGDVLTGLIAGLLSQKLTPEHAAMLGIYLHGTMADQWVKKNDYLSLMASDLLTIIAPTMKKLRLTSISKKLK